MDCTFVWSADVVRHVHVGWVSSEYGRWWRSVYAYHLLITWWAGGSGGKRERGRARMIPWFEER